MTGHSCNGSVRGALECAGCRTDAARRGSQRLPGYAPLRRAVFRPYADGVADNLTAPAANDGTGRGAFVATVEVRVKCE